MNVKNTKRIFLGIPIDDLSINEIISIINKKCRNKTINIMSANITALRRFDNEYYQFSKNFDLLTADGKGLTLFSNVLGEKISNHVRICDLTDALISNAYKNNKKVYLLGAKQEVNSLALKILSDKYPKIKCKGHHGYFSNKDINLIISEINIYKPHLIIVGISSPKKERVILEISKQYFGSVNVASGGYIDLISGVVKGAPKWLQKSGMEWIYRFIQEPRRMFGPMLVNGFYFLLFIFPCALFTKIFKGKYLNIYYFDPRNFLTMSHNGKIKTL